MSKYYKTLKMLTLGVVSVFMLTACSTETVETVNHTFDIEIHRKIWYNLVNSIVIWR